MWIGIIRKNNDWFEMNGMKLEPHKHDWAENEPSDAGSCAVADKALG